MYVESLNIVYNEYYSEDSSILQSPLYIVFISADFYFKEIETKMLKKVSLILTFQRLR